MSPRIAHRTKLTFRCFACTLLPQTKAMHHNDPLPHGRGLPMHAYGPTSPQIQQRHKQGTDMLHSLRPTSEASAASWQCMRRSTWYHGALGAKVSPAAHAAPGPRTHSHKQPDAPRQGAHLGTGLVDRQDDGRPLPRSGATELIRCYRSIGSRLSTAIADTAASCWRA